ncbi:MAG: heme ABC exporter ATP-binding protein CcmA [Gemmatimonadetes bacterium]|nr:heme ABC exporter ATP-binding protein CcmA [Gemmatimonadota bacterium]
MISPLAIDARGIGKRFGRSWALRGLDLTVLAGQSVCLLGPNGSGKTTFLRVLATATRPTQGEAFVFGHHSVRDGDEVRRRVGLLSHRTFLYGELTALENLRFAAGMYGVHRDQASLHRTLTEVGLDYAAHRRVRGFSQGMIQRLALARATLHQPPLLLLDEPYSALDATALQLLDRFLDRFVAGGGTMIVVTHQIERGLAACERAVAIKAGRLVYDGPSDSFLSSPQAAAAGDWA